MPIKAYHILLSQMGQAIHPDTRVRQLRAADLKLTACPAHRFASASSESLAALSRARVYARPVCAGTFRNLDCRGGITAAAALSRLVARGCRPFSAEKEPLAPFPGASNPTADETPATGGRQRFALAPPAQISVSASCERHRCLSPESEPPLGL